MRDRQRNAARLAFGLERGECGFRLAQLRPVKVLLTFVVRRLPSQATHAVDQDRRIRD